MQKQISSKIVAITFGVLVILFAVSFYIFAWQEPGSTPPTGNVDTPLNAGSTGQSKKGNLALNTDCSLAYGLLVPCGNVGIGTTSPTQKLEVVGNIKGTQLCIGNDCRSYWPAGGGTDLRNIQVTPIDWDAIRICQAGTCCPPWKDCDGDGRTYQAANDCDEGCATCFVGSTASNYGDGHDQDCDGLIDEPGGAGGYVVLHNQQSGLSCNTVCTNAGYVRCVSVGTDAEGTNNGIAGAAGYACGYIGINCAFVIVNDYSGCVCPWVGVSATTQCTNCRCEALGRQ